jgi:hypothetical protein
MKSFVILFLSFFIVKNGLAQERDKIKQLLNERETLYQRYKESESLATGLFGNRSKEDMQTTIKILNDIIDKDNEILTEHEQLKARSDVEFTEKYNELIQQVNDLSQKNLELIELSERHKGFTKENHVMLEEIEQNQGLYIAMLGLSVLISILYISKYISLKSKYKKLQRNNS